LIARSHDTLGTPEETRPLREKILAEAVEKFKAAVKIKRNHHYALFNWSEALREWAATISPELVVEREALLAQADAKMREAGVFQKKWFFGTLPTNGAAGLLAHTRRTPSSFATQTRGLAILFSPILPETEKSSTH